MNKYQTFIGIDPGKTGAIAILSPDGIKLIDCPIIKVSGKNQPSPILMASELKAWASPQTIAIIENVHSMPGQGVCSMFSFGMGYGAWLGIIAALSIPLEFVTPQAWKKHFGLIGATKDASRIKAMQLFPEVGKELNLKKNNGRAEALLMAEYLKRKTIKDQVA